MTFPVYHTEARGPVILRDLARLQALARVTRLRVSFSITTDREDVRRLYEPRCAPIAERIAVARRLREAGIAVYATLAPLLPCNPESLIEMALDATGRDIIGDPFHVRAVKSSGATTREAANRISEKRGYAGWHEPAFQSKIVDAMRTRAMRAGRRFGTGPGAFGWLAETNSCI